MALDAMRHHERYDASRTAEQVAAYDEALASHYRGDARTTTDDSWSHDIDAKFSQRPRDGLRDALKRLGFDFS